MPSPWVSPLIAGCSKLFTYLFIAYYIDEKLMQYLSLFHLPHSAEVRVSLATHLWIIRTLIRTVANKDPGYTMHCDRCQVTQN